MVKTAAALLVLLAGAAPALAQPQVPIALRGHQFVPAVVAAPPGVKVELRVHNEEATPAEFESASLHREQVVTPGATISVFVGPLDPGSYEFFDDFNPATRGHLVVK